MSLHRRDFLIRNPLSIFFLRAAASPAVPRADLLIAGGGTGGVAAALSSLQNGLRVILTEETGWIGGQLTSQAVPPDEHPWIESFGATRTYRAYRHAVRAYYRRHFPLTEAARGNPSLNPGGGLVSSLTHEPRVSLAVLEGMLARYLSSGQLTVLLEHKPVSADTDGDRIRSVSFRNLRSGAIVTAEAPYFIDSTEMGDLLPLTRTEYVTGAESQGETGEPHAPPAAQPANMQAFTVCFAVSFHPGEDHTIDKPAEYSFWRDYTPALRPPWPGKLLSWRMSNPVTLEPREVYFDPAESGHKGPGLNLWLYRRIVARAHYTDPRFADATLVNWPQNDYWLGNLFEVPEPESRRHLARARQLSLSLLYWLQTEAPRPGGGHGWPGLKLRPDLVGTADGLAMHPYIRESRRLRAEFTVLEQHVGTDARRQLTGKKREEVTAEAFSDSVGIGSYRIDLHPSSGGDNYIDVSSLPFQIPLGALLPRRVENLLAGGKNLGVTHITNGCYRLHPVEWNVGEAAGALVAEALSTRSTPRAIRNRPSRLKAFQDKLIAQGVELAWPRITPR